MNGKLQRFINQSLVKIYANYNILYICKSSFKYNGYLMFFINIIILTVYVLMCLSNISVFYILLSTKKCVVLYRKYLESLERLRKMYV